VLKDQRRTLVRIPRGDGALLYFPDTMAIVSVGGAPDARAWGACGSIPLAPDLAWHPGRLLRVPKGASGPFGILDELDPPVRRRDLLGPSPAKDYAGFHLVVFLTDECNCRCRYCYLAKADRRTASAFTPARVGEAMAFLRKRASLGAVLRVTFHGGEPLMRFPAMRHFVREADDLRDCFSDLSFGLYTNGTIVTEEIARFLDDHRFEVEVSADGAPEAHDRNRVSAAGRPTFRRMAEGARRLLGMPHLRVSASAVVTRQNLDLAGIVRNLQDLGFERVILRYAGGAPFEPTAEDLPAVADAEGKLAAYLAASLADGSGPTVSPHAETLEMLLGGDPRLYACRAGRSAFFAGGDGAVYPCLESSSNPAWKLGSLSDDIVPDTAFVRPVTEIEECSACWARFLCGGPCPARSMKDGLDHRTPSPLMCTRTKIFCAAVLDLVARLEEERSSRTAADRRRRA
jgi:uncharacterized protein